MPVSILENTEVVNFKSKLFWTFTVTFLNNEIKSKVSLENSESELEVKKDFEDDLIPVSYTHLDVYKRQGGE